MTKKEKEDTKLYNVTLHNKCECDCWADVFEVAMRRCRRVEDECITSGLSTAESDAEPSQRKRNCPLVYSDDEGQSQPKRRVDNSASVPSVPPALTKSLYTSNAPNSK